MTNERRSLLAAAVLCLIGMQTLAHGQSMFIRGDTNGDGLVDVADAVFDLTYQFYSGPELCLLAHDTNDDEVIDISDPVYSLTYQFSGGPTPPEPFPECGPDPTPGSLGCSTPWTDCAGETGTVAGRVLTPDGKPIGNLTVRIVGTAFETRSEADGSFRLEEVPAATVGLWFDARTGFPRSSFQARVNAEVVGDETIALPGPVFIPLVEPQALQAVHGLSDQTIRNPGHPGVSLRVSEGGVFFPDGTQSESLSMTQIEAAQLPVPLPGGQISLNIFSVQPSGTQFDPPAPITFPNYDGFLPGAVVPIMAMDADCGEWIEIGTGTVNSEGTVIESDPGVGLERASCCGVCCDPVFGQISGYVYQWAYDPVLGESIRVPVEGATVRGWGDTVGTTDESGFFLIGPFPLGCSGPPICVVLVIEYGSISTSFGVDLGDTATDDIELELGSIGATFIQDHQDHALDGLDAPVSAIAADGAEGFWTPQMPRRTSVRLDIRPNGDEPEYVRVSIAGPPLSTPVASADYGRLLIDNTVFDGSVGDPIGSSTAWLPYSELYTREIAIRYEAPSDLGDLSGPAASSGRDVRQVRFLIEGANMTSPGVFEIVSTSVVAHPTIDIVRTPVLFVHGMTSSPSSFSPEFLEHFVRHNGLTLFSTMSSSCDDGIFCSPYFVDYASVHANALADGVVAELTQKLDSMRATLATEGIAGYRFDLVAHSYGGLASRAAIAQDPSRVRRLVTIGTPHLGATSASRLLNLGELVLRSPPDFWAQRQLELVANVPFVAEALREFLDDPLESPPTPIAPCCLHDLRFESLAVDDPTFGFDESIDYRFVYGLDEFALEIDWGDINLQRALYPYQGIANGTFPKAGISDHVVSAWSATAGLLPGPATRGFANHDHGELTQSSLVGAHVAEWLRSPNPVGAAAVPVEDPSAMFPVITGMNHVTIDPGVPFSWNIEGLGFSSEARLFVQRGPSPDAAHIPVELGDYTVQPERITVNFPSASEVWDRGGYLSVSDRGMYSNRVAFYRPGLYPAPLVIITSVGSAIQATVEHVQEQLEGLRVWFDEFSAVSFEAGETSALPSGRFQTTVTIPVLPSMVSGVITFQEFGGEVSPPVPVQIEPTVESLSPSATEIGSTVVIAGRQFGLSADDVVVTVGGVPQPIMSVSPEEIVFIVGTGSASGEVTVTVRAVTSTSTLPLAVGLDSDFDGLPDSYEIEYGLNPLDPSDAPEDLDSDGLTCLEELTINTNPVLADTDSGGVLDGDEVTYGLDPLDSTDDQGDSDLDGLTTAEEIALGTTPSNPDTDVDGLLDGEEVEPGLDGFETNPLDEDTDGDGLLDGGEVLQYGSDPTLTDTDFDQIPDGEEVLGTSGYVTDPADPDSDSDDLGDFEEIAVHGTSPIDPDTDGDSVLDGLEVSLGSDPLSPDTDGDGFGDGFEYHLGISLVIPDASTSVTGAFLLPDGSPAFGATVTIIGSPPGFPKVLTDTDGEFTFPTWPVTLGEVSAHGVLFDPPAGSVWGEAIGLLEKPSTDLGSITMQVGMNASGIVLDELGVPMEGATVTLLNPPPGTVDSIVDTASDGVFRFVGIPIPAVPLVLYVAAEVELSGSFYSAGGGAQSVVAGTTDLGDLTLVEGHAGFSLGETSGSNGETVDVEVELLNLFDEVAGLSFSICNDPSEVMVTSVTMGSGLIGPSGRTPHFVSTVLYPQGWTTGVVLSFFADWYIPVGDQPATIFHSEYEILASVGTTCSLCFSNALGPPAPDVESLLVLIGGMGVTPPTSCGSISVTP